MDGMKYFLISALIYGSNAMLLNRMFFNKNININNNKILLLINSIIILIYDGNCSK